MAKFEPGYATVKDPKAIAAWSKYRNSYVKTIAACILLTGLVISLPYAIVYKPEYVNNILLILSGAIGALIGTRDSDAQE